jgi:molybdenum cofactor sulfurtransferase
MASRVAELGTELLSFERFREASAPRLAYGYGPRNLRELRESEFGRLAGEAGGQAWGTRVLGADVE